jgi:hypothetical protein
MAFRNSDGSVLWKLLEKLDEYVTNLKNGPGAHASSTRISTASTLWYKYKLFTFSRMYYHQVSSQLFLVASNLFLGTQAPSSNNLECRK